MREKKRNAGAKVHWSDSNRPLSYFFQILRNRGGGSAGEASSPLSVLLPKDHIFVGIIFALRNGELLACPGC